MKKSILTILALSILGFSAEVQVCSDKITKSAPDVRFENDDTKGISKDLQTGLTWYRCPMGKLWSASNKTCEGTNTKFNWQQTLLKVNEFNNGDKNKTGIKTWRLANMKELISIKENACSKPSLNATVFPNFIKATAYDVETYIWSSTKDEDSDYAKYFAAAFNQTGSATLDSEYGAMLVSDTPSN